MPEPKRLSTKKLFDLARKQKEAKQREADAKKDAATYSEQVIAEMRLRKTKALESEEYGIRVNKTEGETTSYDVDAAQAVLTPAMFNKVTKRVIDPEALNEQITAGKIKAKDLKKFVTITPKAPYITVTFIGGK